jgi:IMP dehydrogenase
VKFLYDTRPNYDLTYSDVFLVPQATDVASRMDVNLETPDGIGTTLPIAVSNMTAVAGRRMAETVTRRGGIVVLPQNLTAERLELIISSLKSAHLMYDTPISLTPQHTVGNALQLIHKRSHRAAVIVNDKNEPIGIFTEDDAEGKDLFMPLRDCSISKPVCLQEGESTDKMFAVLHKERLHAAPVVNKAGKLVGMMTAKGVLRSALYRPAVDDSNKLLSAVAMGINGDVGMKAEEVLSKGADVLVLDTAHGHQKKMIQAIKAIRSISKSVPLVAGNVVTKEATADILKAGADIVKVGVGPGAMCTTRMMTGVGRPQFSAVYECAEEARQHGGHVWADGGIRYPRDVALALAAGASNVMFASWLAGTYESAADMKFDNEGRMYKENYGMASRKAVRLRTADAEAYEKAKKELFEEGISTSRLYVNPEAPGVEDIIDQIVAGVRSACTYAGASTIEEFQEKAIIGIQSASGYQEGKPVPVSWQLQ